MKNITRIMKAHYEKTFAQYGANAQGVDWGKHTDRALLRQQKMSEIFLENDQKKGLKGIAILDVGCGYGEALKFLTAKGNSGFDYTGIDVAENMIQKAKKMFPKGHFFVDDFVTHEFRKKFDYLICNGIFTQKLTVPKKDFFEFMKKCLKKMKTMTKKGFVFNVMSSHVNFEVENLFYYDPGEMLSYLLKNISKKVRIDHSYGLYEYTCYVYL